MLLRSIVFIIGCLRRFDNRGAQLDAVTEKPRDCSDCCDDKRGALIVSQQQDCRDEQTENRNDNPGAFHQHYRLLDRHWNRSLNGARLKAKLFATRLNAKISFERVRALLCVTGGL